MTDSQSDDVQDLSLDMREMEAERVPLNDATEQLLARVDEAKPQVRADVERELGELLLNYVLPTASMVARLNSETQLAAVHVLVDNLKDEFERFRSAYIHLQD